MIKRLALWTGITVLVCTGVVAAAGKARLVRPDILAALACTPLLFRESSFGGDTLLPYRDTMQAEAAAVDLPPEVLAVIISGHQYYQTPVRDYTDCAGSALGANLSLGLAQVRMSTATENTGSYLEDMSHRDFHRLRRELLAPHTNIHHAARELRALLERPNRFPGLTAEGLLEDPFKLALLLSEYRAGWTNAPADNSRLSANAISDMHFLLFDTVYLFDRTPRGVSRLQDRFRGYLNFIYCSSGIFNGLTCMEWQEDLLTTPLEETLGN